MLTRVDFENLLRVVRASVPSSFDAGKSLVVLEGNLLQVIRLEEDARIQNLVDAKYSQDGTTQVEETPPDGDDTRPTE